jgi:hypothetical protein
MAQAVNRWPLTSETQFHARVSPFGNCGGQSGPGIGFCPSSSVFRVSFIPSWLSVLIYHLGDE